MPHVANIAQLVKYTYTTTDIAWKHTAYMIQAVPHISGCVGCCTMRTVHSTRSQCALTKPPPKSQSVEHRHTRKTYRIIWKMKEYLVCFYYFYRRTAMIGFVV